VDERLDFFRGAGLWLTLSDEVLRAVLAAMQPMKHDGGQLIIRQGEPGSHLHVLTSGRAEVRVRIDGQAPVTVATLGRGDCFGEMSLLAGETTSADVIAAEASETLALERGPFNALVAANPNLLREFASVVIRRLRDSDMAVGVAYEKERELLRVLHERKSEHYDDLAGKHPATKELWAQIEKQAGLDSPLLIQGERGTGKELIARLIHYRSRRKDAPLISLDCAQITEITWGDKLFGDYHRREPGRPHPRAFCYMDLAEGGTILLKNIDSLPLAVQERLVRFLNSQSLGTLDRRRDVRVMSTFRGSLADMARAKKVSPALAGALSEHGISVPPLRQRKRDIPHLASHFLRRHAKRLNKPVKELDGQAVTKLVSYDYSIANVRELEEAVERAVILADEEDIKAEEVFLGPPPAALPWGFNLLRLPKPIVRLALRVFPGAVQGITAAVFAFLLYQCLLAPAPGGENLGTHLVWSVWWPALVLSFFFMGRAWCAVCPMALAGTMAQRAINLKWRIPAWLKNYDVYVMMAGFFAIVWAEEVTGMRQDARATGVLLLVILGGAIFSGVVFPRRTWCRHACPLGGLAGVLSTAALVELRPTADLCAAKCQGHSCYAGGKGADGCPMFNHVMFLDSNQHCALCMNCVRSCPNGSPQLNVRMPARELWTGASAGPAMGRFVGLLLGLLVAQSLIQYWEQQPYWALSRLLHEHRFVFVSGVLALGAAIPLLGLWLATVRLRKSPDPATAAQFWRKVVAWVPLMAAGFACYQIAFGLGLGRIQATLGYQPLDGGGAPSVSFSLLSPAVFTLLLVGLALTAGVLWRLRRAGEPGEEKDWIIEKPVSAAEI
jgi:transcriptional regulator with AAA-type ATPase domain